MKLQKPKGTQDILPADSAKWQYVENVARETFKKYNYGEIRTPMFEHYEVISRSVGDTTDIVTKEMYDFHDKGDRHITLAGTGMTRYRNINVVKNHPSQDEVVATEE